MNFSKITKEFTEEFLKLLEISQNIVITSHFSPDGDSISSVLSMYRVISDRYKDKNIRIIYSNAVDEHFKYFENFEKIEWVSDMADHINGCDLLIMLDCGKYDRLTLYGEKLDVVKNQICIDHHPSESNQFTLSTIVPEISSCSELIFRLFESHLTLDKNLAETFLLGILSDTADFNFIDFSQSEAFLIAKKLIDSGNININILKSEYTSISKKEFNLLQEFVKNTSFGEVEGWPPLQYTYADREFVENGQYSSNEISAASSTYMAHYMRSIKDYTWGFLVRPKSSHCSVSMRAMPRSINVRDVVERMSLGSGHDRAAAGNFKREGDSKDPKACIEQIIEWMKNNKPIFN